MNTNIEYIKNVLKNNDDFIYRNININKSKNIHILYFESLCDSNLIYFFIIKGIDENKKIIKKKNFSSVINSPKLINIKNIDDIFYYMENGFCIVVYDDLIYAIECKASIDRGITESKTEPSMYGAKDAFSENYQKNLGVIKRRIKSSDLHVESIDLGVYTKNKISLVFLDSLVSKKALKLIKEKINNIHNSEITDSYDLTKYLKQNKIFPTILKSERPTLVSKYILKGYIVILMDNTPFALIIDAKLDNFVNPYTTDPFIKVIRYICLFLTILTPAIYIALINYNQETIPISLLIKFTTQRDTVPFPAIVEALMMLFTTEILREADIRFPNSFGSAASILGALILGESAVNAGLVSAIMIIIVAITFITGLIFTEIKLVWGIRILRFILLIIASITGIYGLYMAIIAFAYIIANTKMYDGEYL